MPLHDGHEDLTRLMATAPHRRVGYFPIRTRDHSERLGVDVSRVVGFRVTCACGWVSPTRQSVQRARSDYNEHAEDEHSALAREAELANASEEPS